MKDGRPVVLVTGAQGFIGSHLARLLERSEWTVRRAVRTPTGKPNEIVIESVGPMTDWREALVDADAVVHLAARVHHPNEEHADDLYRNVNVDGTLRLARSAADVGVGQFIFVSTILVNGRTTDGRAPFCETDIVMPRGVYGKSKAAAECGLEAMAHGSGLSITVVRPPLVYGAGARGNFKLIAQAVARGIPLPFGSIHNRRAFLAVENLCSFIRERLARPGGNFDIFLLADKEQVSTPEFIKRLARATGTRPFLFPMPIPILSSLLKISGRPEMRDSIVGSLELDVSKALSAGWRADVTLDEGLRHAIGTIFRSTVS